MKLPERNLNMLHSVYLSGTITDKEAILLSSLLNMTRNEIGKIEDLRQCGGSILLFKLCVQKQINIDTIINGLRFVVKNKEQLNKVIKNIEKEYKRGNKQDKKNNKKYAYIMKKRIKENTQTNPYKQKYIIVANMDTIIMFFLCLTLLISITPILIKISGW